MALLKCPNCKGCFDDTLTFKNNIYMICFLCKKVFRKEMNIVVPEEVVGAERKAVFTRLKERKTDADTK